MSRSAGPAVRGGIAVVAAGLLLVTPSCGILARRHADAWPGSPRGGGPAEEDSQRSHAPVHIRIGPVLGWPRAFIMDNGIVEALIVPDIGRIMEFRLAGRDSPFWHDARLHGQRPNPGATNWLDFGGDKAWPAPRSDWGVVTGRAWPPPAGFDAVGVEMAVRRNTLVMYLPEDPNYGIRAERVVALEPGAPVMTVATTFEKVSGPPVRAGICIHTQLRDAELMAAPVHDDDDLRFAEGFSLESEGAPPETLTLTNRVLSLTSDPARATTIAVDTGTLLWVGRDQMLRIDFPRAAAAAGADPQGGGRISTHPGPNARVELETFGPIHVLKTGDRIQQTNTYILLPRTHADPRIDARHALSAPRAAVP